MSDISEIWKYDLRQGHTDHPRNGACLFDAGMWLVYGKISDNPPCSCPVIRAYGIGLNDRMLNEQRQRLKPFILRIVGNRDPEAVPVRIRFIVLETARRVVPLAYEQHYPMLAKRMRALPDDASYPKISYVMREAAVAAAAYAADAVADAADAAYTVAAVAAADADAAAAAYAAYTVAADTGYAENKAWDESIAILDGALRIGKQSPEFDEGEVRAAVARFELARA